MKYFLITIVSFLAIFVWLIIGTYLGDPDQFARGKVLGDAWALHTEHASIASLCIVFIYGLFDNISH